MSSTSSWVINPGLAAVCRVWMPPPFLCVLPRHPGPYQGNVAEALPSSAWPGASDSTSLALCFFIYPANQRACRLRARPRWKMKLNTLASVAPLGGASLRNRKVAGPILVRTHACVAGVPPGLGALVPRPGVCGRQPLVLLSHCCFSLSLSLSLKSVTKCPRVGIFKKNMKVRERTG